MQMHERMMKRQAAKVEVKAEVFADVSPGLSKGVRIVFKDDDGRVCVVFMKPDEVLRIGKLLLVAHAGIDDDNR